MGTKRTVSVKDRIEIAFLELLGKKPYSDISVTDIIREAEVARVSYYRNYSSINDIANSIMDKMAEEFQKNLYPLLNSADEDKLRSYLLDCIGQYRKHYTLAFPRNQFNRRIFFNSLHGKLHDLEISSHLSSPADKYRTVVKLSVIENVIEKWAIDGFEETPVELAEYLLGLLRLF